MRFVPCPLGASVSCQIVFALAVIMHPGIGRGEELKVVPLYGGAAPGAENSRQIEREFDDALTQQRIVVNVVKPTLTVVQPPAEKANGCAAIIRPGGGFAILSIDREGLDLARFLADRGITCFVLKYLLMETKTDNPFMELFTKGDIGEAIASGFEVATPDALAAVRYVRENAEEYGVDPERVGIVGFSAGGMLATAAAVKGEGNERPAFAATLYGAYDLAEAGDKVASDTPPMFVMVAGDDPLNVAPQCIRIYEAWAAAKRPAELHVYMNGGHGFGMKKQGLPSDTWGERFVEWLAQLKMLES